MMRAWAPALLAVALAGCSAIDWNASAARTADAACRGAANCTRLCPDGTVPSGTPARCPDPTGRTGLYVGGMMGRP